LDDEEDKVGFLNADRHKEPSATTWIGNTGASCHLMNSDIGMYDVEMIQSPIKIGNGKVLIMTKIGKKQITTQQQDASTQDLILTEVKFVPTLYVNLFSIGKVLKNGFDIGNKGVQIFLKKGTTKIVFDKIMSTKKGFVAAASISCPEMQEMWPAFKWMQAKV
jgi:hypothetical protein